MLPIHMDEALLENAMYYTEANLAFMTRSQAQAIKSGFGKE